MSTTDTHERLKSDKTFKSLQRLAKSKPEKQTKHSDGQVNGLCILHRKTGTLSFIMRYRFLDSSKGKNTQQEINLGTFDGSPRSLGMARDEAVKIRHWVDNNQDPKLMRAVEKEALEAAARKAEKEQVTVKTALEFWLNDYCAHHRAESGNKQNKARFENHIYPYIGDIPLALCTEEMWRERFKAVRDGNSHIGRKSGNMAAVLLQACKQALAYCKQEKFAVSDALRDVKAKSVGRKVKRGNRTLTTQELADVLEWTENETQPLYYRAMARLLIVFGCRTQELRLSDVREWDLNSMIWTVPEAHNKARNHDGAGKIERPIPEAMRPLIETLKRGRAKGLFLGESKSAERVSTYGQKVYLKLGHSEPWSFHDLRRTFATRLNDLEVSHNAIEKMLGHVLAGVQATYNHSQLLQQKQKLMTVWMRHLEELENE